MTHAAKTLRLSGKTLTPGLGRGRTAVHRDVLTRLDEFCDIEEAQTEEELLRAGRVDKKIGFDVCAVFAAHIAMAQDWRDLLAVGATDYRLARV